MTLIEERTRRKAAPGYWAIEVQLTDRSGTGPRHLCHALNDHEAVRMAGHLVGSSRTVHGFDYFPLELPIAGRSAAGLPGMGESERVSLEAWPALMAANTASEATFAARVAKLDAPAAHKPS